MDRNKLINIFRYLILPVPLVLYFIYFAITNKGAIAGVIIVGFFFIIIIIVSIVFNLMFFKIPEIIKFAPESPTVVNGIPAKVKIKSITYTNRRYNKYPVYNLVLDVFVEGRVPYEIRRTQVGTPAIIIKMNVGNEYSAFVDAADNSRVQIDDLDKFY